jgi:hypothetical protein
MSKKEKILSLLSQGKKVSEVAKATKVKPGYVYYVRWTDKQKQSKIIKAVKQTKAALDFLEIPDKPVKKPKPKKLTKRQVALAKKLDIDVNEFLDPIVQHDPKAEAWKERNPWFGEDKELTAQALGYHEELVRIGVNPKSDKYWQMVDAKFNPDPVNRPAHYTAGGIDFIDFAEAKGLTENAYLFNVVKYVVRAGKKVDVDPVQDLEKAEFYLKREIARRKRA